MSQDPDPPTHGLDPAPKGSGKLVYPAGVIAAAGLALTLGAVFHEDDRTRMSSAYLWAFTFLWTVVLGSLFFVALQHATRSVWSVVLRRVAEALAAEMWAVALLFLPILVFVLGPGLFHLFPWTDPEALRESSLLAGKHAYLNPAFFALRAVLCFGLWLWFSARFVGGSVSQDSGAAGAEATLRMRTLSAPFLILFAFTASAASIDWIMSLEAEWSSTIFGVYIFSGMVVAALAAITLGVVLLRQAGCLGAGLVTEEHLYSLGALMFAFVCFWAYIAFSQYMLMWYGNFSDETVFFVRRTEGDWLGMSLALCLLRFFLPFVVLLPRRAKMDPRVLAGAAVLLLAGQALDLYWLIMPRGHATGPVFGWQELGPALLVAGVMVLCASRFLSRHATLPVRDPLLATCLRFHL